MMNNQPTLEFFYEFASTYSYLSAMRIEELAKTHNVQIRWRPFLLGPIFAKFGWQDSPFNIYPVKGAYMWRDLERTCLARGLPFKKPSVFPRNGLLAARVALYGMGQGWGEEFSQQVFLANFGKDLDINSRQVLTSILKDLSLEAEVIFDKALSPGNKKALKLQTEQAQSLGVFGAPSFVINGELFWGDDRLEEAMKS